MLKKNEWADSAFSTALLQGSDKKKNKNPDLLKLPVIVWYHSAEPELLVGMGHVLVLAVRSWKDASQAQHQTQITLPAFAARKEELQELDLDDPRGYLPTQDILGLKTFFIFSNCCPYFQG